MEKALLPERSTTAATRVKSRSWCSSVRFDSIADCALRRSTLERTVTSRRRQPRWIRAAAAWLAIGATMFPGTTLGARAAGPHPPGAAPGGADAGQRPALLPVSYGRPRQIRGRWFGRGGALRTIRCAAAADIRARPHRARCPRSSAGSPAWTAARHVVPSLENRERLDVQAPSLARRGSRLAGPTKPCSRRPS